MAGPQAAFIAAMLAILDCRDCERLKARLERSRTRHLAAAASLKAAELLNDSSRYMALRQQYQETKVDLEMDETEFRQHQDRHAVPN